MEVNEHVIRQGNKYNLTEGDIISMVRKSASYSHPIGNARFGEYWFLHANGEVLLMGRIGPMSSGVRMTFPDAINCKYCRGSMLVSMYEIGKMEKLIPCPRMKNKERPICHEA